jgi:enoyl-CoA hydratase
VFGLTEVQRGLFPLAGSTVRLRRQVSYAVAAELLPTGDDISAARALELGLSNDAIEGPRAFLERREPVFTGT